jgi:SAM-dependent methyltransferase
MNQQIIWQHFQNEAPEIFQQAEGRIRFLAHRLKRRRKCGDRVLNVGVGAGLFEQTANQFGMDVFSLDPNEETVARLNKQPWMKGQARAGYLESIPFTSEAFDAVVVSDVLEHLSDEVLQKALGEIHRVLSPGGIIMGTVPARENLKQQMCVCPHCGERFHRWGHQQSFDEERLRTLLSRHFRVEVVKERFMPPRARLSRKESVVFLLKQFLLRAGMSWPGSSLYFCAGKR